MEDRKGAYKRKDKEGGDSYGANVRDMGEVIWPKLG